MMMEEAKMFKTLFTTRFFEPLGISLGDAQQLPRQGGNLGAMV
jgi:hypothetical protein